jgi:outer membrane lipoprotein-sorting protein
VIRTRHAVAILLLAIVVPLPSARGEARAAGIPAPLVARLEKTAAGVKSLASDFVQEKHLSMFKTVVTSKGRFYYKKPDRLRWELVEPVASGFVLTGRTGRRWHERTGRTEAFDIGQEPVMKLVADQLFAWTKADFTWLRREYRIAVISEAPVTLRLEPVSAATAGFLDHLLITFSADGTYVRTVELHEKDGDFTRIRFVDTAVNTPLPSGIF